MISIAIGNFKGGVGKTTTAIHIASLLAYAGKEVLLLDLDSQINSALCLGLNPKKIKSDAAKTNLIYTDYPHIPTLHIGIYQGKNLFLDIFNQPELNKQFEYVILDLPPKSMDFYEYTLKTLEYMIIPLQCEYFAMEGLAQFLSLFYRVKNKENPGLVLLGYLVTLFDWIPHQQEVLEEMKRHFSKDIFSTLIPKDPIFSEAASFGKPAFLYQPASLGAVSYVEVVIEIMNRLSNRVV